MPIGTYRSGGIGRYIHEDILDQEWDSNLTFEFDLKQNINSQSNLLLAII